MHWKTRKLVRESGLSTIQVVGGLNCLWAHAGAHAPDGSLEGMSDEDIALAFDPDGGVGPEIADQLRRTGWVVNGHINDWLEHNPLRRQAEQKRERRRQKKELSEHVRDSPSKSRNVRLTRQDKTGQDKTDHLSLRSGDGVGVVSSQDGFDSVNSGNSQVHSDPDRVSVSVWFETVFWPKYPRKVGKETSKKIVERLFKKLSPEDGDQLGEAIMDGLEHHIATEWQGRDDDKKPYPATWLNQRRWTDAETQD